MSNLLALFALPITGFGFLAFLTISKNRARSFHYEQQTRDQLADQGRSAEVELYVKPIHEWRQAGWITHLSMPPNPHVGWVDKNLSK